MSLGDAHVPRLFWTYSNLHTDSQMSPRDSGASIALGQVSQRFPAQYDCQRTFRQRKLKPTRGHPRPTRKGVCAGHAQLTGSFPPCATVR